MRTSPRYGARNNKDAGGEQRQSERSADRGPVDLLGCGDLLHPHTPVSRNLRDAGAAGERLLGLRRSNEKAFEGFDDRLRVLLGKVMARLEGAAGYLGCSLAPHRQDIAAIEFANAAAAAP
jgi:hypothetical protein